MIKNIFKLLILLGLVNSVSFAGDVASGNVTKYEVTINKMEIYNSTTATWVVMSDTPATVNIASGSAGADVASMISPDTKIPYGTYTQGRVTISDIFTINACDGGGNCTNGVATDHALTPGTTEGGTGAVLAAGVDTTVEVDFPAVLIAIGSPAGITGTATSCVMVTTFASPLVVDDTLDSMNVNIQFNLNNVLSANAGALFTVDFPGITVSLN